MHLTLANDSEKLGEFLDGIEGSPVISEPGIGDGVVFPLRLVLEELLTNIIKYGYDDRNRHEIEIDMNPSGKGISVRIADDGHPFNPLTEAHKTEIVDSLENQEIGGLGIHLVKQMARNLSYHRQAEKNIFEFWIGEDAL